MKTRNLWAESTSIAATVYDAENFILEIEFLSGTIYQYFSVAPEVNEAFLQAPSKGSFFNQHIRNHFLFTKLFPHVGADLACASGRIFVVAAFNAKNVQ